MPVTDTYIEKDLSINDEIEKLRLSCSSALLSGRKDVIVVSSVSCLYGIGNPADFHSNTVKIKVGQVFSRTQFLYKLVDSLYSRNDVEFKRGTFRVKGDSIDIYLAYGDKGCRVIFFGDEIEEIEMFDPVSGGTLEFVDEISIFPANIFSTTKERIKSAVWNIQEDLVKQCEFLHSIEKHAEAKRLKQRVEYDLEMIKEIGYCSGIENYSRYFDGRSAGTRPFCLLDYFPDDFLTIIDESHVSVPQIRAMYNGDQARKEKLVEYGFRLPSAKDNRPLTFDEFNAKTGSIVFCSATPGEYEYSLAKTVARQIIRPTGLMDPEVEVRPLKGQIDDLIGEIRRVVEGGGEANRVIATTLTKRSAEDLTDYLGKIGIKVEYIHSDIDAIERVAILQRLRKGQFDVLVGINLLREGLDLPEVELVAVLDADKEGFLRSVTSLLQTAGRAARHERGRVILYADRQTDAIREFLAITGEHRRLQAQYNEEHGIVPRSVKRQINESQYVFKSSADEARTDATAALDVEDEIEELKREMLEASDRLEFERAMFLRDRIKELKENKRIERNK